MAIHLKIYDIKGKFDGRSYKSYKKLISFMGTTVDYVWEAHLSSESLYLWISSHSHSKISVLTLAYFSVYYATEVGVF